MVSKNVKVGGGVFLVALILAGVGVVIWALIDNEVTEDTPRYTTEKLEPTGVLSGTHPVFTKIPGVGNMFWWFHHTKALGFTHDHPVILWLDGVTGIPPSLLANFGMFGRYDINLVERPNSWVNRYNLLFIDAPLGRGFSHPLSVDKIPKNIDEAAEHLVITLESFYEVMVHFKDTPIYVFGEGHGAQLALALVKKLHQNGNLFTVKGVILGNGLIAPVQTLTKLGFYLEELAYVDGNGRRAIESLTNMISTAEQVGRPDFAGQLFQTLGRAVNEEAGAVAVNLGHIVQKLTNESLHGTQDYYGQWEYLQSIDSKLNANTMNMIMRPLMGVSSTIFYDFHRQNVVNAFKDSLMISAVDKVEYILNYTDITVSIYNGNLDAVSNTPGQLEWVNNLKWYGQPEFLEKPRLPIFVNGLLEGYYRNSTGLQFYWVNVAGLSAPLDNPVAMDTILRGIIND
ncbi:retinoid-inducible serine carboxypeptidase-like [Spodoptera frugiperda]|uniref:Retinoid-inducible serine carboxypeptidase-like n=1 Tax=Spodoptera frugiperda TaxID=7108 RepID=A0A9R0CYQ3_SPOFR|nr:retinoid-inducible serine carboxypeptidase-like [Spodoptera frugiperda]